MKRLLLFGTLLVGFAILAFGAGLNDVKRVYLLPMPNGLDQYLAVKLTQSGAMQVVTDPHTADAVLTDQVGKAFEDSMKELYRSKKDTLGKTEYTTEDNPTFVRVQSGSHVKGNAFLVNPKTGDVIWSTSVALKDTTPEAVKRVADRTVDELVKAMKGK